MLCANTNMRTNRSRGLGRIGAGIALSVFSLLLLACGTQPPLPTREGTAIPPSPPIFERSQQD